MCEALLGVFFKPIWLATSPNASSTVQVKLSWSFLCSSSLESQLPSLDSEEPKPSCVRCFTTINIYRYVHEYIFILSRGCHGCPSHSSGCSKTYSRLQVPSLGVMSGKDSLAVEGRKKLRAFPVPLHPRWLPFG